jgi:hypothetical protein
MAGWWKVAAVLAPLAGLALFGAAGGASAQPAIPACGDARVQTLLRTVLMRRTNGVPVAVRNIGAQSRTPAAAMCTATVITGPNRADITYRLTMNGSDVNLLVTGQSSGLPPCDHPQVQAYMRNLIGSQIRQPITSMTRVGTASRTASNAACTAHIAAASGAEADITYSLARAANNQTDIRLTGLRQTRGPTRPAAGSPTRPPVSPPAAGRR